MNMNTATRRKRWARDGLGPTFGFVERNIPIAAVLLALMIVSIPDPLFASTVSVRSDGKLVVDGQPFFPFGFFANVGTPLRDMDALGQNGFNTIVCNNNCNDTYYAQAQGLGVKVIQEVWWDDPRSSVAATRSKPALLAYYVADDINIGPNGCSTFHYSPTQVAARSSQIQSYDLPPPARHLTTAGIVLAGGCRVTDFTASVNMLMGYNYPIDNWGSPNEWLEWNVDAAKQLTAACAGGKCSPVMVNQTFAWPGGRLPTAAEIRNMNYAAIVYGVAGVVMYSIADSDGYYLPNDGSALWTETKREAAELRAIAPMLLDGQRTVLSNGRLHLAVWTKGTKTLLIAANSDRTNSLPLQITLPAGAGGGLRLAFSRLPRSLVGSGRQISGSLARDAVTIYSNYL